MTRSRLLTALLVIGGMLHSFLIAEQFAYTGYWDDTLLFVRLAQDMPLNPIEAVQWTMAQSNDLYGPLILIPIYFGKVTGLLSNWYLILIANLILVALVGLLVRISISLGFGRAPSLLAGFFVYLSPQLIDQRTWYVPTQHSLTTLLLVLGSYLTYRLLQDSRDDSRPSITGLVALNSVMFLLALSREIAIPFSAIAIITIISSKTRHRYTIAATWLTPLLMLTQGVFSGRGGHRIDQWGESNPIWKLFTETVPIASSNALGPLLVIILISIAIQCALLAKFRCDTPRNAQKVLLSWLTERQLGLYVSLAAIIAVVGLFPRGGAYPTSLLAASIGWPLRSELYSGHAGLTAMDKPTIYLVVAAILICIILVETRLISYLLAVTLICTAPYVGSTDSMLGAQEGRTDLVFFTRYSVYFLPVIFLFIASIVWRMQPIRLAKQLVYSSLVSFAFISTIFLIQDIEQRTTQFRSVLVVSDQSAGLRVICPSAELDSFLLRKYPQTWFPDITLTLGRDYRFGQFLTDSNLLSDERSICLRAYDVHHLAAILGGQVSGTQQEEINLISQQLDQGTLSAKEARQLLLDLAKDLALQGRIPD